MLRWLLILAMALLPWHGWAGAAVAVDRTAGGPAIVAGAAHHDAGSTSQHAAGPAQAGADCPDGHGVSAASHHVPDGGCPGCAMCHSCAPVGLPAVAGPPGAAMAAPQRPVAAATGFASADSFPQLKPPIS